MQDIEGNIYFEALKHGTVNMQGISCNAMIEHLKGRGIGWNDSMSESFHYWFFRNFYEHHATLAANRKETGTGGTHYMKVDEYLDRSAIMTGEAYMRYVDILELKEARAASQTANTNAIEASRYSRFALFISGAGFVIATIISIYALNHPITLSNEQVEHLQRPGLSVSAELSNLSDSLITLQRQEQFAVDRIEQLLQLKESSIVPSHQKYK